MGRFYWGNSWRTTGDLIDTWESLSETGFTQADWKNMQVRATGMILICLLWDGLAGRITISFAVNC